MCDFAYPTLVLVEELSKRRINNQLGCGCVEGHEALRFSAAVVNQRYSPVASSTTNTKF